MNRENTLRILPQLRGARSLCDGSADLPPNETIRAQGMTPDEYWNRRRWGGASIRDRSSAKSVKTRIDVKHAEGFGSGSQPSRPFFHREQNRDWRIPNARASAETGCKSSLFE